MGVIIQCNSKKKKKKGKNLNILKKISHHKDLTPKTDEFLNILTNDISEPLF